MEFTFTEEQLALQSLARRFARECLAPNAPAIDEKEEYPWDNIRRLAELGFVGLMFPAELGGGGVDTITGSLVIQELSYGCPSTTGCLLSHWSGSREIVEFGHASVKERLVADLVSGKRLACQAVTEPNAGSDPASMESTAKRKGDFYILNGTKRFISNHGAAEVITTFAKTEAKTGGNGITAFVVEGSMPGFSFGRRERKMGMRGFWTGDLYYENLEVPETYRIGEEGGGFNLFKKNMSANRCLNSSLCVGLAQAAYDQAITHAKERVQFGRSIAQFQGIQWMLAEMNTDLEIARLLIYRAAHNLDNGLPYIKEVAQAKLFAPEMALRVANQALQIFGGYGYMKDHPLERYARDARLWSIAGGSTEIQKNIIARQILR